MNKLVLPLCLDWEFLGLVNVALRLLRSPDTVFQIVSPGAKVGAVDVDAVADVAFGATVATGRGNCVGLSCLLRGGPLSTVGFACALAPAIAMAVAWGLAGIVPRRSASVIFNDSSIDSILESSDSSAGGADGNWGYNLGGGGKPTRSGRSGGVWAQLDRPHRKHFGGSCMLLLAMYSLWKLHARSKQKLSSQCVYKCFCPSDIEF